MTEWALLSRDSTIINLWSRDISIRNRIAYSWSQILFSETDESFAMEVLFLLRGSFPMTLASPQLHLETFAG